MEIGKGQEDGGDRKGKHRGVKKGLRCDMHIYQLSTRNVLETYTLLINFNKNYICKLKHYLVI